MDDHLCRTCASQQYQPNRGLCSCCGAIAVGASMQSGTVNTILAAEELQMEIKQLQKIINK